MNLKEIQHIHMIGVGGIGMSALARLFLNEKKAVSGSDITISPITEALEKEGVVFFPVQNEQNITDGIDLVVYTEAMDSSHPELVTARTKGIKTINYFEALGMVANEYYLIAVAGTHGKTTTTAMLIDILEEASYDPTAIVGSLRTKTKSNFRAGKSKYFVIEACEYKRDFLTLEPDVLIITNIEHEHVDYYKNLEDVQSAFRELAMKVQEDGAIVANLSDIKVQPAINQIQKRNAGPVEIIDYGKYVDPLLQLTQHGVHNHMNAAAASATASFIGIEKKHIRKALENFAGTWRRFEYKGEINGAVVYDDYAHHPTEIKATLKSVKEVNPKKNITVIFQPHTYTRTNELFADFVEALNIANSVILVPIYAAREENKSGVSSEKIAEAINKKGGNASYYDTFDEAIEKIKKIVTKEDFVVVMGAGNVVNLANKLVV